MNIEDARKAKAKLERAIGKLVGEFEEQTDISVADIFIERHWLSGHDKSDLTNIRVVAEMETENNYKRDSLRGIYRGDALLCSSASERN